MAKKKRRGQKSSDDTFIFYTDAKAFKTNHAHATQGTLGFYDWQNDFVGICLPHIWNSITYGIDEKTVKHYIKEFDMEEHFIDRVSQSIQHEELHRAMWSTLGVEASQKLTFPHTYHELMVRRLLGEYNELHLINYMATDVTAKLGIPMIHNILDRDLQIMKMKVIALLFYMFAIQGLIGLTTNMLIGFRIGIGIIMTWYLFTEIKIFETPWKKTKKSIGKMVDADENKTKS